MMANGKMIEQQYVTEMAALGRQFQLGGLYDYRNDIVLKDDQKRTGKPLLASTRKVDLDFKLELKRPDSESWSKWENMALDEHLQASTVAGIIDKFKGASNYLNDRSISPTQVLICLAEARREQLDLPTLISIRNINEVVPSTARFGTDGKSNATHVVVGITYGAEVFCVIFPEFNKGNKIERDITEEAEEKMSDITDKMKSALEAHQKLSLFKEKLDKEEKQLIDRLLKCRLYADLQSSPFRECNVFDAYKDCLKLIEQMKSDDGKNKAVPISIQLCPLAAFPGPMDGASGQAVEYRDVDTDLVTRCCRIWADLEQVSARSDALKKVGVQFGKVLKQYQDKLRKSLKAAVIKARESDNDDEVEGVVNIAETLSLFKWSRLDRWIRYKQAEIEMAAVLNKFEGITFLASQKQLEKKLTESFSMKYALVLYVPPLDDERTKEILQEMTNYVENFIEPVAIESEDDDETDDEEEDEGTPWHMVQRKRNQVLAQIQEFVDHVDMNKHLKNKVHFLISTFDESGKGFGCTYYSVYDAGKKLLPTTIISQQLPVPPAKLRIASDIKKANKKLGIRVEWDYEDLGYPITQFLVEYRLKDSSGPWKPQKTTKPGESHLTISCPRGTAMEIRVAADTCIGRSEFSDVVDTESILDDESQDSDQETDALAASAAVGSNKNLRRQVEKTGAVQQMNRTQQTTSDRSVTAISISSVARKSKSPPTDLELSLVSQSSADVSWLKPSDCLAGRNISYRVRYWESGRDKSSASEEIEVVQETECRIRNLKPKTTYSVEVVAVSGDGPSEPSKLLNLTTLDAKVRFAQMMTKRCTKIINRYGMDIYAVPLTKTPAGTQATANRLAFGKPDGRQHQHGRKTILLMGATGAGKTSLINGMINFIFDVQWDDPFRFQLIQEQQVGGSQAESQTSKITAYDIHHVEGFRVPYSLTIVDTPGYGDSKGLQRDKEITEMVKAFFEDKNGIQVLDVVGFVIHASLPRLTPTQTYIFDSLLAIFGNDVKDNINLLLTFADSQVSPVLGAIKEAKLPHLTDEQGNLLHHKFNNSGFFCSNRESGGANNTNDRFNRFYWRMGMENFEKFFNELATMKTKSLSLTKQVLEERKKLEMTIDGLQPLIKNGLSELGEMRKIQKTISSNLAQIEANQNFEFVVEKIVPVKVNIPSGQNVTNCNKCHYTCHETCVYKNDKEKIRCWAMDSTMPDPSCRICSKKCIWNMHTNQPYKWKYVIEKHVTSSDDVKKKYERAMNKKLTAQELLKEIQRKFDQNEEKMLELVTVVSSCIQRLDEIALRPNPFTPPEYIDMVIDAELRERHAGFVERIESWKKLREMAVIARKIKKGEKLLL